jgi:hypothetical protein
MPGVVQPDDRQAAGGYVPLELGRDAVRSQRRTVRTTEHQIMLGNDDDLIRQWRSYRADMQRGGTPPARLDFTLGPPVPLKMRHAQLDADVQAVWWSTTGTRSTGYKSAALRWRFTLRDDDGWRITRVAPPAWCGGYVDAERCGRSPDRAAAAAGSTAAPLRRLRLR